MRSTCGGGGDVVVVLRQSSIVVRRSTVVEIKEIEVDPYVVDVLDTKGHLDPRECMM